MYIFKKVKELQQYLHTQKMEGNTFGYVPTMGALHQGHLKLINQSVRENTQTICSIFVNPTQFDDKKDLDKYPRPIELDIEKLEIAHCDILFLPTADEVYPTDLEIFRLELHGLDQTMEGAKRDGHFAGVVQVVHRLLDIVQPNRLYMGQKDYQQFTIIKYMLKTLNSAIELICVPIVRESDGLAMSSRNVRLSESGREQALYLSKALFQAREDTTNFTLKQTRERANAYLIANGIDIDYLEIADGDTLQEVDLWEDSPTIVVCATINVDGVRLLDNVLLKKDGAFLSTPKIPSLS